MMENQENKQLDFVFGKNNVTELLLSDATVERVLISGDPKNPNYKKIIALCKERGVPIVHTDASAIARKAPNVNHQGVIAYASQKEYVSVEDILKVAENRGEAPFVIIADEIVDPHNLGAILRSADAFGAHGIIISKRRAVGLTPSVAKASGGAIHHVPVSRVSNLAQTVEDLKKRNIWVYGCDMAGENVYYEQDYSGGVALIVGSEESGISRILRDKCDFFVRIPMKGKVSCLNASVAASVIMQEIAKKR
jgi:23S rRNA (guanosine2251-2'-O)-methyltransferase